MYNTHMDLTSKKVSLLVAAITAMTCSRLLFFFFNDPEGPNLLVVTGMAVIIYLPSVVIYLFTLQRITNLNKLLFVIFIQILIVCGFYFGLK